MNDPEAASAVQTPPPAKTEYLGPAAPHALPQPDPADFRSFLGLNRRLDSMGSLGHYEVLEILGRGGFGIVFKAFDEKLERFVAIKMLEPALSVTSPARKSFLREARSAAKVRHENVVQIYAVEEQPLPYLVMEYIEGETLQHRLDSHGPLTPAEIVAIGQQICAGLAAAHDQGLIHRDIKPANILIERGPNLKVKLTDFGLARTADDASQTRSGVIVGTPLYMAPEQATAESIDHRADLFSLGSVLYAMASGRPPFRAPTSVGVMNRVVNESPRPIRNVIPDVPEGLCQVITQLHAKKPESRPASAHEVAENLGRCLTLPVAGSNTDSRKRRGWPIVAVAVGVLVFISVMALALRSAQDRPRIAAGVPEVEPIPVLPVNPPAPARVLSVWEKYVATLPPDDQVLEVCKQFKSRRAEFDIARVRNRIENGQVVMFEIDGTPVSDLSPIRGFPALQELIICNTGTRDFEPLRGLPLRKFTSIHNVVDDLSALKGMPLIDLTVWSMNTPNLEPIRGMKLEWLNCGDSPVSNLGPLEGMPLKYLCVNLSKVEDVSVLKGMPLKTLLLENVPCKNIDILAGQPIENLHINGSSVTDLSVLHRFPNLKEVTVTYVPERDRDILLSLNLRKINGKPAEEILNP